MNSESYDYDDDFEQATDALERKDYKTAYKLFLRLAAHGDAVGQYSLGLLYDLGDGIPQNYKKALKWCRLAAEQGDADGQNNLGLMYYEGKGVPQDNEEAVKWWRLAAGQRDERAQYNLAMMQMMHDDNLDCLSSPN